MSELNDGLVPRIPTLLLASSNTPSSTTEGFISESGSERQLSITQNTENRQAGAQPSHEFTHLARTAPHPQHHAGGFISFQPTKSGSSELISSAALLLYQQRIISKECFSNAAVLSFRGTLNLA